MGARSVALVAVGGIVFHGVCEEAHGAPSECPTLIAQRDWRGAKDACVGARWQDQRKLAEAWLACTAGDWEQTRTLADELKKTALVIDATYLTGYVDARDEDDATRELGLQALRQALFAYLALGRPASAAFVADYLARSPRPYARFVDAHRMSSLAVYFAERSRDPLAIGAAQTGMAEYYDDVGMWAKARAAFDAAEAALAGYPARLAFAYLKHATLLISLGSTRDLRNALEYLADAEAKAREVEAAGGPRLGEQLFAVALNRAYTLAHLGELEEAARALGDEPASKAAKGKWHMVRGYIAARDKRLADAQQEFDAAGTLGLDYRWGTALAIGELHEERGDVVLAEQAYRAAVDAVEELRRNSGDVEIRPWVLASRAAPYTALVRFLIGQGRPADALAVAESLHARAWQDVVIGRSEGADVSPQDGDRQVSVRAQGGPPPDTATLLTTIGDREVLVFTPVGDELWRVHVTRGTVRFTRINADQLEAIDAFRAQPDDARAAAAAADGLLPELQAGPEPLYLVATGPFDGVPFAALRRDGRFLIEDRPLASLPGLIALECRPGTWDERQVFIGDSLGNLPRAAEEVERLAGSGALVGRRATVAALTGARGASLLHAAVHGRLTPSGGALVLADGIVSATDIIQLDLAPRTVVLTGCATAANIDSEAWSGFPSAFLAAGSRHVVATLRSVDDAQAALFAKLYYEQGDHLDPILRLAAAQRAAVAQGLPVAQWAPFAVWGVAGCDAAPPARSITASANHPRTE